VLVYCTPMIKKTLFFLSVSVCAAHALEVREYTPDRHNRFMTGSSGLEINPNAYYDAELYTGVAFDTNLSDSRRQFVLVTPEHILLAKHFSQDGNITFINSDGTLIHRTIASRTEVLNDSGGVTDIMIAKLSAPLTDVDKITPLPYAKLATEAQYIGRELVTFGLSRRAGRGTIASFTTFSQTEPPAIGATRSFVFDYTTLGSNGDDAYAVIGDSGSPTFTIENGKPALVGLHLAAGTAPGLNRTIDSFVPHYDDKINALLASEGYQLILANPDLVALNSTQTVGDLGQLQPGSLSINLENNSGNKAANVTFQLSFPAAAIPDSINAAGWIVDNPSSGEYHLRRATLGARTTVNVTALYGSVPVLSQISVTVTHDSDGSSEVTQVFNSPVRETFAGFVSGLDLKGATDDPDQDGFQNLIEYALGGDPAENAISSEYSIPLNPQTSISSGEYLFSFPRRTDALVRGLTYQVEFSDDLSQGSFSSIPPEGSGTTVAPYDPAVAGFEKFTITIPLSSGTRKFARLMIALDE